MPHSFRRSSLVIGLASAFLLTSASGCGNPPPTVNPSNPAPPAKTKDESRPPSPDPG